MIIQGKAHWCKLVGAPTPGYDKDELQWSVDLSIDEDVVQKLLKAGMKPSYVKDKGDDRGKFLQLVRKATKVNGEGAKPVEIIDDHGEPWPEGKLIGNGSIINVALSLNTVKWKGEKWLKPSMISVQVWDHKEYQPKGFPKKVETKTDDTKDQW